MKHNVKFAPEKRNDKAGQPIVKNVPIFAFITFGGKKMYFFTGYRIDVDNFDYETQEATKNSTGSEGTRKVQYNEINKRMKAIRANLELFFQKTNEATKEEVKTLLDEVCNKSKKEIAPDNVSFFGMFQKYIDNYVSPVKRNHVKTVFNHWKRYEAKRKFTLSFEFITVEVLRNFERYLENEGTKPKGDKMIKSPKGRNTRNSILRITRAFWNYSKKELKREGIEIHYPFGDGYQVPPETYGKPIYITIEERNLLFNAILKTERLQRVRDIFVFQCLIGTRVDDLCKLTKSNIQNKGLKAPHK